MTTLRARHRAIALLSIALSFAGCTCAASDDEAPRQDDEGVDGGSDASTDGPEAGSVDGAVDAAGSSVGEPQGDDSGTNQRDEDSGSDEMTEAEPEAIEGIWRGTIQEDGYQPYTMVLHIQEERSTERCGRWAVTATEDCDPGSAARCIDYWCDGLIACDEPPAGSSWAHSYTVLSSTCVAGSGLVTLNPDGTLTRAIDDNGVHSNGTLDRVEDSSVVGTWSGNLVQGAFVYDQELVIEREGASEGPCGTWRTYNGLDCNGELLCAGGDGIDGFVFEATLIAGASCAPAFYRIHRSASDRVLRYTYWTEDATSASPAVAAGEYTRSNE